MVRQAHLEWHHKALILSLPKDYHERMTILGECRESMANLLHDKVAIVTGARDGASVKGRGPADGGEEGAKVVAADIGVNIDGSGFDQSVAEQVVAEIREDGGRSRTLHAESVDRHEPVARGWCRPPSITLAGWISWSPAPASSGTGWCST